MTVLKRTVIALYSGTGMEGRLAGLDSHLVRIILAEKSVPVDVIEVDEAHPSEELAEINPYNTLPTLVDRELILYDTWVIMEYLDERFPHPPLWPVYPVVRAKSRMMIYRIRQDWYPLCQQIYSQDEKIAATARKELRDGLVALTPVFDEMPYFLSEEFSLVDCTLAPLLWRLPELGIVLPRSAKPIEKYAERIFSRDSFQASLTEAEREIRETDDVE